MRNRILIVVSRLVLTTGSLVACGSNVQLGDRGDAAAPSVESGATSPGGDAAGCNVVVTAFDTSCTTAADCVAVPPGGDTCNPCSAGSGDFVCGLAAMNVNGAAGYRSKLDAALAQLDASTYQECVVSSCPTGGVVLCQKGQCALELTDAGQGTDAGAVCDNLAPCTTDMTCCDPMPFCQSGKCTM